jgi:multidrug efflux pump subunit AcrA (membrane-fusion protein)
LENSLRLIPVSLKKLEAMEKSALLKIKEARRALDKTVITLPFKARIGEVFLEKDQFISIGQPLFKAYGTDLAEIAISLTMDQLKSIIPIEKLSLLNTANINPDTPDLKENILGTREFIDKIGLKGTVFLEMSGISPTWEAKFTRFTQGLDPVTRTVGLIAAVDRPYDKMIPGQRPPLLKGMHVKVILQNPDFEELYLMPRHACENNTVLTINSKGLLKKLLLKPDFIIDNLCGFKSGFENSDKIITSHLIPAIQDSSVLTESDTKWQNIINDQIRKYGQAE